MALYLENNYLTIMLVNNYKRFYIGMENCKLPGRIKDHVGKCI